MDFLSISQNPSRTPSILFEAGEKADGATNAVLYAAASISLPTSTYRM
jgi:hypothetical protein